MMNLDSARVSVYYWEVYKRLLRLNAMDFKSRVKERLVRDLVSNPRARARGYSPANAAINFLHQRRLAMCRNINTQVGLGTSEGLIHVATRNPGIGLLLDLADPFKLADKEKFLEMCMKRKFSQSDFVIRLGRQRSWYFYPKPGTLSRLDDVGRSADEQIVSYGDHELPLSEAYREYTLSVRRSLVEEEHGDFQAFVYGTKRDLDWIQRTLNEFWPMASRP